MGGHQDKVVITKPFLRKKGVKMILGWVTFIKQIEQIISHIFN